MSDLIVIVSIMIRFFHFFVILNQGGVPGLASHD